MVSALIQATITSHLHSCSSLLPGLPASILASLLFVLTASWMTESISHLCLKLSNLRVKVMCSYHFLTLLFLDFTSSCSHSGLRWTRMDDTHSGSCFLHQVHHPCGSLPRPGEGSRGALLSRGVGGKHQEAALVLTFAQSLHAYRCMDVPHAARHGGDTAGMGFWNVPQYQSSEVFLNSVPEFKCSGRIFRKK